MNINIVNSHTYTEDLFYFFKNKCTSFPKHNYGEWATEFIAKNIEYKEVYKKSLYIMSLFRFENFKTQSGANLSDDKDFRIVNHFRDFFHIFEREIFEIIPYNFTGFRHNN